MSSETGVRLNRCPPSASAIADVMADAPEPWTGSPPAPPPAPRLLRVGPVGRPPADLRRNVEIGRRSRLLDPLRGRNAELRVIDMAFEVGEADAHHVAALDLMTESLRMQHGAAIRDAQHFLDFELAGLGIELDLGKAHREARRDADAREIVLCDGNEAGAGDHADTLRGHRVDVLGHVLAGIFAAEFDRFLRSLRIGDRLRCVAFAHDLLVAEVVVFSLAAEYLY